jgi:hypothetical protein
MCMPYNFCDKWNLNIVSFFPFLFAKFVLQYGTGMAEQQVKRKKITLAKFSLKTKWRRLQIPDANPKYFVKRENISITNCQDTF